MVCKRYFKKVNVCNNAKVGNGMFTQDSQTMGIHVGVGENLEVNAG
jgi:hypothetical protein